MQESAHFSPFTDNVTDSLKIPPHSIEAEQSVLGGLLFNNEAWIEIADLLTKNDFYLSKHKFIFGAIETLLSAQQPCDIVILEEQLESQAQLEKAGGHTYLGELYRSTPSAANILAYAKIVRERAVLRQLIEVGNEIIESAFNARGHDVNFLLETAEKRVFNIAEKGIRGQGKLLKIQDIATKVYAKIGLLEERKSEITGLPTGFIDFDRMTSGLQPSDLIIVAGRPSMGKCLAAESEIVLSDGYIATIEDLYRQKHATLLTLTPDQHFQLTQPSHFVEDGIKPVFRVCTLSGRRIETTLTHPFLTPAGWRPLIELAVGNKIAVPKKLPLFGQNHYPDWEIKLLAYVIGNTTVAPINNADVEQFLRMDHTYLDIKENQFLASWLENLGILGLNPAAKFIPKMIFGLKKSQLALFLKHLFAQGGSLDTSDKIKISYCAGSQKLAQQLQHLLLRFGILASLKLSQDQAVWQLEITDWESLHIFGTELGIFSKASSWEKLKEIAPNSISTTDIHWDAITAIEKIGEKQVYDLTILTTQNFVANDICVHNTSFAMNVAEHVAVKENIPVAIFSMEMSVEQLTMRLFSSLARVNLQKVRTGQQLNDDDWARLTKAHSALEHALFFIDDSAGLSPTAIGARLRRLVSELARDQKQLGEQKQLGLVIIDYLQLMQVPNTRENRATEVSEISRSLKALAKELNVPVMALSQLNRGLEQREEKRPRMADLRESGGLEQDADLIAFIYRDEVYDENSSDKGIAEVIIGKQRNGPIGTVKLTFLNSITKFENYTGDRMIYPSHSTTYPKLLTVSDPVSPKIQEEPNVVLPVPCQED